MGVAYATGTWVPKNLVEADKWLTVANANGEATRAGIAQLEASMTKEQIEEAKRLAKMFMPSKPVELPWPVPLR